jgi:arsenical pump membrane protein
VVTAVLSLDATVVLLTPVVLATTARMRVPALPHAYAAGHLANSASLLLPVSNLTNLLAFAATGLSFLHFTGLMLAPWVVATALEYLLLRAVFRGSLRAPAAAPGPAPEAPVVALGVVAAVVAGFGLSSLVDLGPVWPAAAGVAVLAARGLRARATSVTALVRAADLPFAAFALSLAVVVTGVLRHGLADVLDAVLPDGSGLAALLGVAAVAAVLANVVNNLPATLALLPVLAAGGPAPVLAALIGVNIGPNLSYVGSLANLLWRRTLGTAAPSALRFSGVGALTVPITLTAASVALWAALQV